jgi:hypothetical protein
MEGMNRFAPALRRTALELDLPPGARAALILEMAADLEALFDHHRAQGLEEEEAARLAEVAVLGSPEVIRRLARIHRSSWRSWSEAVGAGLGGGADLALLVLGVLPMLLMAVYAAALALTAPINPLVWILLVVGALLLGLMVLETGRVIGGGRGGAGRLPLLLLLAGVAPALGGLILALGARSALLTLRAGHADAAGQAAVLGRAVGDVAALALGLLLGIAGLIAWFVLRNRIAVVAQREVERLIGVPDPPAVERAPGVIPLSSRRRP